MSPLDLTLNEFLIFVLVLLRMGGVVVFAPFFGGDTFLRRARIGLAVFFSFCVYNRAEATLGGMELPLSLIDLALLCTQEILVGLAFGYAGSLIFTGAQLAGEVIGQQIGFTLANVVDPVLDQEVGIISFFQFSLAMAIFLALDLHLVFLYVLGSSYEVVGLGAMTLRLEFLEHLGIMFGGIWDSAVQLAGPVLLVMLLVSVVVGFLVRTMPQLNIIVIGLPSRVLIGLLTMVFGVKPFMRTMAALCEGMLYDLQLLLQFLGPEQAPVT